MPGRRECRQKNSLARLGGRRPGEPSQQAASPTRSRGTFTITNPGVFGALFGMPINQPQVAIRCRRGRKATGGCRRRTASGRWQFAARPRPHHRRRCRRRIPVARQKILETWDPNDACSSSLGLVPAEAPSMQRQLVEERRAGRIEDAVGRASHVLTLGVKGDGGRSHVLASGDVPACGVRFTRRKRGRHHVRPGRSPDTRSSIRPIAAMHATCAIQRGADSTAADFGVTRAGVKD